jgi:Peptidase family M28
MENHMLSIEQANAELTMAAATEPTPALTLAVSNPEPPAATPAPQAPVFDYPQTVCPDLVHILSRARPHQSPTETEFVTSWLTSQILAAGYACQFKSHNLVVSVPTAAGAASKVLFSCHTDTVHHMHGIQDIAYDPTFGHVVLSEPGKGVATCLGADDGAGIWLMLEMIRAKVPGTYVFHRGEERGCIGSRAMADEHRAWLQHFDCAIAFDRPGFDEVITHQLSRTRCASDEFGKALATALSALDNGLKYSTSDRGMVTDTAQYRRLIPECVNIGVGYQDQHGKDEFLDYGHLVKLRDACLSFNWEELPIKRDPTAYDASDTRTWASGPTDREVRTALREPTLVEELGALTVNELCDWVEADVGQAALAIMQLLAEIEGKDARYDRLSTYMRGLM